MNRLASSVKRILCVDDSPAILSDYRKVLAGSGADEVDASISAFLDEPAAGPAVSPFDLSFASQGKEALELVVDSVKSGNPFTLAFVDMRMPPGWNGAETIRHLRQADPGLRFVVCTAFSDVSEDELRAIGGADLIVVQKPFSFRSIERIAREATRRPQSS